MKLPTKKQIEKVKKVSPWDFGNEILYKLCAENFKHNKEDIVITKVLFIGRIYAAAIERMKKKEENISNEIFYIKKVAPIFLNPNLDKHLLILRRLENFSLENIQSVLEVHYFLMESISEITHMNKRSLCSKYLHFHLPELFFIYDSRAVKGLKNYITKVPSQFEKLIKESNVDIEYANFFCKCFELKTQIEKTSGFKLTIRQFDKILIN